MFEILGRAPLSSFSARLRLLILVRRLNSFGMVLEKPFSFKKRYSIRSKFPIVEGIVPVNELAPILKDSAFDDRLIIRKEKKDLRIVFISQT